MSRDARPAPVFRGTERFEIVKHLGSGGMGAVYEAFDRDRRTRVALKVLHRATPQALLRFKREFRALADLQHRNLVHLGELFEFGNQFFFTMELVTGTHFADYVRVGESRPMNSPSANLRSVSDNYDELETQVIHGGDEPEAGLEGSPEPGFEVPAGRLREGRLRAALRQLARGVQSLHAAAKVHRDIKPSNIVVTDEGRVVLLDFGLVDEMDDEVSTEDGLLMGTLGYMAPEQTRNLRVGPAADWYGVGAVLYQALTGRPPFTGSVSEILRTKLTALPLRPSRLAPDVPADLDQLCMELLAIEPDKRPPGDEVLRRLGDDDSRLVEVGAFEVALDELFVGRELELDRLRQVARRVSDGRPEAVLVHGESGVGKSALVRSFCERLLLADPDAVVLRGRCYERESVPYKALDEVVEALGRVLASRPDEQRRALLPPNATLLGQVFPALRRGDGFGSPETDDEELPPRERRTRAFAALRKILHGLGRQHLLVIAIDDLQWTDRDSLALLTELFQPPNPPRVLLLCTVRTSQESAAGLRSVGELAAEIPLDVAEIEVGALAPPEAAQLVRELLAKHDTPIDIDALVAETRGHPMLIDALLRYRLAQGAADAALHLDDALRWRVSRLEAGARELLELVCVSGRPVRRRVAAWAIVNDEGVFGHWLGGLRQANLVRTSTVSGEDWVEPFHDRVREAVVDGLDAAARTRVHIRLAVAMESCGAVDPEALALHWFEAGHATRAVEHMLRAAEGAVETLAFDRSARLYRWCLDHHSGHRGDELDLRVKVGEALVTAGRGAEGARQFLAVAPHVDEIASVELKRRAAEQLLKAGYVDQGFDVLRDVVSRVGMSLPRTPKGALVRLLARRAALRIRGTRFRPRRESEVDPALLRRIDVAWSAAAALSLVDTVRGMLFQARHFVLALQSGENYRLARAFAVQAWYASNIGYHNRETTYRMLDRARELAERSGRQHAIALVIGSEGAVSYLMGLWRIAAERARAGVTALAACREGTMHEVDTLNLFGLSAMAQLGSFGELGHVVPALVREADDREDRYASVNLRLGHINATWLALDRVEEARHRCDEAAEYLSTKAFYVQHYYDMLARVQIDLYRGEAERAYRRVMDQWKPFWGSLLPRVQHPRMFGLYTRCRVDVARAWRLEGPDRRLLLDDAEKMAARLARESAGWGKPAALAIGANVAAQTGAPDRANRMLLDCEQRYLEQDMPVHAAAAKRARGELVSGDEGAQCLAEADAVMRTQGVVAPERFAPVLVPRCVDES